MRNVLIVLLLVLLVLGAGLALRDKTARPEMMSVLPWQVEVVEGKPQVFGLTLGVSRLADAVSIAGDDVEIAVLEAPGKPAVVELFGTHFAAGNLSGSIEVMAQATPDEIVQLKDALSARTEMLETGARKTALRFEQQQRAFPLLIRNVTFVPVAALDAALAERYFGQPGLQLATADGVTEYFYPDKGVVIILNEGRRDFIQYVQLQDIGLLEQEARQKAERYLQSHP